MVRFPGIGELAVYAYSRWGLSFRVPWRGPALIGMAGGHGMRLAALAWGSAL